MVSDSPYQTGDLLLRPLEGAVAGVIGSFVMLAAVSALGSGPQQLVATWLDWVAGMMGGSGRLGLGLHALLGAVLGVLYASSQQRLPWRTLLGIGAFYGLLLWIAGRLLLGWVLWTPVHSVVHSWAWLTGACAYGITLALLAGWAAVRRPSPVVAVPRD